MEREKMKTETSKQIDLLSGASTLAKYTDQSPAFEEFVENFDEDMSMIMSVKRGLVTLTDAGVQRVNEIWNLLLQDYLELEDECFEDLNALVVAVHVRGVLRGSYV